MANKLPVSAENPVDVILLHITDLLQPFFKSTGHTANILTTYSFVCGLAAIWSLHRGHIRAFSILLVVSYFFDCADGQFARRYKQTSEFGDYYDHVTDIVVMLGLAVVVWQRYRCVLLERKWVFLLFLGFFALQGIHFGCQQRFGMSLVEAFETLDVLRTTCHRPSWIYWTRWFGSGSSYLLIVLTINWLEALRHT